MTADPSLSGYAAFNAHRNCAVLQAWAPAENLDGTAAIRYWHAPENQGDQLVQYARPHDAWRRDWMQGWDRARADFEAEVEAI